MDIFSYIAPACFGAQLAFFFYVRRQQKQFWDYQRRLQDEVLDTWAVIIECMKVMSTRDDFDSKHVMGLIRELHDKYPSGSSL